METNKEIATHSRTPAPPSTKLDTRPPVPQMSPKRARDPLDEIETCSDKIARIFENPDVKNAADDYEGFVNDLMEGNDLITRKDEYTKPLEDTAFDITGNVMELVSDLINNHGLPDSVYDETEDYLTKQRAVFQNELDPYWNNDSYTLLRNYYEECLIKLDELREAPFKWQKSVHWADPIVVSCA